MVFWKEFNLLILLYFFGHYYSKRIKHRLFSLPVILKENDIKFAKK